ncbi:MAG: VWA domain-containing protein [Spirochaetaceae bacterium]|nr:VWA domain-containing protein [Spirochaetaceae bacterium]
MNKYFLLIVLLLAGLFFIIPSQAEATPVDMVVLLDTSGSVFSIYNDLLNYVTKNIISDYLKFGDTFHLISFDSEPSLILSKKINNKNDIEYILKDLFLLYPFGKHTDLISALKYLRNYVSGITNNSNREIVILTDGIHNPPSGSPYQSVIEPATGVNLLQKEIDELTKTNWKISIVKLPGSSQSESSTGISSSQGSTAASSGSTNDASRSTTDTSRSTNDASRGATDSSRGTADASRSGTTDASRSGTGTSSNISQSTGSQSDISSSTSASSEKQSQENSMFTYIDDKKITSTDFNNSSEEKVTTIQTSSGTSDNTKKNKNNILLLSILGIILLIIIIFVLITRYYSRASVKESYNVVRNDIDIKGVDQEGSKSDNSNRRSIIMKVTNQNDQIVGTSRNIHPFKIGAVKSVGGGNSSYLIFLYKLPGTIASLKFDGDKYIFTPLRPEFFPEIGDKEIENPLDKIIKIKTEKQHILTIKFGEYISPLEKINSIMHLTEHRGVPLYH